VPPQSPHRNLAVTALETPPFLAGALNGALHDRDRHQIAQVKAFENQDHETYVRNADRKICAVSTCRSPRPYMAG